MKKNYETVFILTPVLPEDQVKSAVKKFVDVLKKHDAEIINEEIWGIQKLAYSIEHKKTGYYVYVEFFANVNIVNELETEFRRDEKVMRFLTTSLDKHAIAYNDKRRSGAFKKNKTTTD